jgi:CRP-like cAMP-binding protein
MHMAQTSESKTDIKRLVAACLQNSSEAALAQHIKATHWEYLGSYLQPTTIAQGQVLISQGASDRTVYFLESGNLSVHYEDAAGRVRLAIVGHGSAVGEGSFFSHQPRNATVQAASVSRVWALTPVRFSELTNRQPATALAVTLALGALLAVRMLDRRKRISVT